jgi:hypothetical protein
MPALTGLLARTTDTSPYLELAIERQKPLSGRVVMDMSVIRYGKPHVDVREKK